MKKSAFISDLLFAFLSGFILSLCLFRHLGIDLILAVVLAFICGILIFLAVGAWLSSRRKSFFLKRSDEAQKQRLLTHLALLSDNQKTNFFEKIFQEEEGKKTSSLQIHTQDAFYFLRFHFSPVTADEVASLFHLKTKKRKVILCDRIEESATILAKSLGVEYKTAESVYQLVKEKDGLPEHYLGEEEAKNKRNRILHLCFAKSNAKRFFLSGVLILFTALLNPFGYYYFIFGSVLLLLALALRIFGFRQ